MAGLKGKALWGIFLLIFWVSITGKVMAQDVAAGMIVIGCILGFSDRLVATFNINNNCSLLGRNTLLHFLKYMYFMIKDIVKANIDVARIVLSPNLRIAPAIVKYRHRFCKGVTGFLYANSITLTPGTLTVEMDGDWVTVHLLDREGKEGLINWKVGQILAEMEGGS